MRGDRSRHFGAQAKVCLLIAALAALFVCREARAERFELPGAGEDAGVVVYPATGAGAHRVTVVLHGMCGEPRNTCAHFAESITADDHLVCPRATRRCEGGGASWAQTGFEPAIERAVARAEAALGASVDSSAGRTLIGYSLGAYRALELAEHGAGRYPRVMLIGARIQASVERLQRNGVERLLLSAGSWDMMHDPMQRETVRLARRGFTTRFLGLGPVGHAFTPTFGEYLPEALAWLRAA